MLAALAKYIHARADDIDYRDCGNAGNWGYGVRNGEVVPMMLDAGLSQEVAREFY